MDKKLLKIISKNLKRIRREKGLTQETLAEKADVHTTTIGRLELRNSNVSILLLNTVAKALEVNIIDLL